MKRTILVIAVAALCAASANASAPSSLLCLYSAKRIGDCPKDE